MGHRIILILLALILISTFGFSQTNPVMDAFPEGTILHGNISYNNDTLPKHLVDIYLPPNAKGKVPLVILIHGGGGLGNPKSPESLLIGATPLSRPDLAKAASPVTLCRQKMIRHF